MQLCSPTCLVLVYTVHIGLAKVRGNLGPNLVRRKRDWILRPRVLKENTDYSHQEFVAKIRSDYEDTVGIVYSLEGVGANKEPYNVFQVNPKNGFIRLNRKLDREQIDTYHLLGIATLQDGKEAEGRINIDIKVEDENDNSPVFTNNQPVSINERSSKGTFVMKVNATDADEPGNPNSKIAYSILSEEPPEGMFYITADGNLHVNKPSLDRERTDRYILTIKGKDLNGSPGGNTGTGTVTVNVLDVNDNPPTFEQATNEVNIEENSQGVEVLRIKSEDLDQRNTENWEAVYDIVRGNEAKHFSIHTDPKTNEGVLMLDKAVDYENVKGLELDLTVRNKAPLFDELEPGTTLTETCSVKVNVINQDEGPYFHPEVKAIPIREGGSDINIKDVIARYPATNQETGREAENVRYLKGSDQDNWVTIDPTTAEIKLNKLPDRESPFLINGTYYAKVLCITDDMPSKTATGTVAIQVEDFNDNCPTLTSKTQTMCSNKRAVFVQAYDEDSYPNGPPFQFTIVPEGTRGEWELEHLNDTAVILRAPDSTWPGSYQVEFLIQDEQGKACPEPQKVKVSVCTCEDGVTCGEKGHSGQTRKEFKLGPACIGLILLGLLTLLLLPLFLLFCKCGGYEMNNEIPFEGKSYLLNYNSEGPGENTMGPMTHKTAKTVSCELGAGFMNTQQLGTAQYNNQGLSKNNYDDHFSSRSGEVWEVDEINFNKQFSNYNEAMKHQDRTGSIFDGMALANHFLGGYLTQKLDSGNHYTAAMDSAHGYNYEGQGSPAGSVGCCSLLESDLDLHFLDDLSDSKFKKLAEVCGGLTPRTEVKRQTSPVLRQHPDSHTTRSTVSGAQHLPTTPNTTVPTAEETVFKQTSERSRAVKAHSATLSGGISAVQTEAANQGQMFLLQQQQPVYYATNPVMESVQYVVQPRPVQTTMVLTEAPATNLQGMVLVTGAPTDAALMSTTDAAGMVWVEGCQRQGNSFNLPGAQTMMVTQGKAARRSLKVTDSQSNFVSGGSLEATGFHRVQMVEGDPSTERKRVQKVESLSHERRVSGPQRSYQNSSSLPKRRVPSATAATISTKPTYRKVVRESK